MAKGAQKLAGKPGRHLPVVAAVWVFTVTACVNQRQPASMPEDFEFLNVDDKRVVEYVCDDQLIDLLELYERMRPGIENALVEKGLGEVPEVIDMSKISLVGLHRHSNKRLVSYLLTEHWSPHEIIMGEVGVAAVVQPCLGEVVGVDLLHVAG